MKLLLTLVLVVFMVGCNQSNPIPILYISDTSLMILFMEHKGTNVYAGNGDDFQYWSGEPTGWKEHYVSSSGHQLIFTRKDIFDLIQIGQVLVKNEDGRWLVKRTYKKNY